ncbi:hypothetical protein VTO73DRAFT_12759 [Trametes versicolor]
MASTPLFFSPNAPCYAVIRMDPVAMVKKLDDPEALAAARAMTPQSYVVYLNLEPELPFPNKPWYRYDISMIAPSLREEDAVKGITADMCVPIYPNEKHPAGRQPLRPSRPFPYTNCYHWCNISELQIRVLPRPELFNEDQTIHLSFGERLQFGDHQYDDMLRSKRLVSDADTPEQRVLSSAKPASPLPPPIAPLPSTESGLPAPAGVCDAPDGKPPSVATASCQSSSVSSASRSVISGERDFNSVDEIMAIFSGGNADLDLLPLCELWLDMPSQLKEEDIPSPAGFFEERDEIVKIIQDARIRAYAAASANVLSPAHAPRAGGERRRHRLRTRKLWRKMHIGVKSFFIAVASRLQLPYLPVWP